MNISQCVTSIEQEYERRMTICKTCPDLKQLVGLDQCGQCGCMLLAKARLPSALCPVNRWELFHIYSVSGMVFDENQNLRVFDRQQADEYTSKFDGTFSLILIK